MCSRSTPRAARGRRLIRLAILMCWRRTLYWKKIRGKRFGIYCRLLRLLEFGVKSLRFYPEVGAELETRRARWEGYRESWEWLEGSGLKNSGPENSGQ